MVSFLHVAGLTGGRSHRVGQDAHLLEQGTHAVFRTGIHLPLGMVETHVTGLARLGLLCLFLGECMAGMTGVARGKPVARAVRLQLGPIGHAFQPDLVILDLMMPELDGLEVCREIRKSSSLPIIMLTARGEESDVVTGLEIGADDYLTKPFSLRELAARIKANVRRTKKVETASALKEKTLTYGSLIIDPAKREVTKRKKKISLTSTEFNLLWILASHPGIVFDRDRGLAGAGVATLVGSREGYHLCAGSATCGGL